jgi:diphosphomevalonate decarboxylase
MKKATVVSPANIAFIKYWGRRNDKLILPQNSSFSMNLDKCLTTTTVEFGDFDKDEVLVKYFNQTYQNLEGMELDRVLCIVNRIRQKYDHNFKVKIYSENNFPAGAGIASSASAFSALTKALYEALEIPLTEKELTIETRLSGSGSACRSIPDGFVVWEKGKGDDSLSSYAYSFAPVDHWDLADVLVIVDTSRKLVGSFEGHQRAENEYQTARLVNIKKRLKQVQEAVRQKDLEKLGQAVEEDAISLHAVAMTSTPPIYYLNGRTFDVISSLFTLRKKGLLGYFTMDAGANVHIICERADAAKLTHKLKQVPGVLDVVCNRVGKGARAVNNHLF